MLLVYYSYGLVLLVLLENQSESVSAQQDPLPNWIHDKSCYRRTLLCERYSPSDRICDVQGGLLGNTGFGVVTDNDGNPVNQIEIKRFLLELDPLQRGNIDYEIWMTTINQTESTSSLVPSDNFNSITICTKRTSGTPQYNFATFQCGSEVIMLLNVGLVMYGVFSEERCTNSGNRKNPYILVAARQGSDQPTIGSVILPHWLQAEGCYDRIVICEQYDSSDPTCSRQSGYLGNSGFRILTQQRNQVEIEGRSILTFPDGSVSHNGTNAVWTMMIDIRTSTSVITFSNNLHIEHCESTATLTIGGSAGTINTTYTFSCGGQALETLDAGIIYFRDLGLCSSAQSAVLITARRVLYDGCISEIDQVWEIPWPSALRGSTTTQSCPGGRNVIGNATRYCNSDGQWAVPNVLQCTSIVFIQLEQLAEIVLNSTDTEAQVIQNNNLVEQLIQATQPQGQSSLPNDLQISTRILSTVTDVLANNRNATDENVIDAFNNLLDSSNSEGWRALQDGQLGNNSEVLLDSAERYALVVATSLRNTSIVDADQERKIQSRTNIVVSAEQISETPSSGLRFPTSDDLVNYTASNIQSEITIPVSVVEEKLQEISDSETLPVFFILFNFLPMGDFIPSSTPQLNENECNRAQPTRTASDILSAQVGMRKNTYHSVVLGDSPIDMNFTFTTIGNISTYHCVFWNFSNPIGTGRWATTGVTTDDVQTLGNITTVRCSSTHLTSFAVLVDVAGGLKGIGGIERTALQIVSYIGCGISIVFLIATIIFLLIQGKKIFTSVILFVHLNLSISLLLALIVFIAGIENGTKSKESCIIVATLLHYFFLSAFCWMLCEGIMVYFLLVVVITKVSKQWWLFLIIGYLSPLPIVTITAGIRYEFYGVKDTCGELIYCWLSVEQGTIFGFVGPMLAIILINVIFLMFALRTLWRFKRGHQREDKKYASQTLVRTVFIASIVLLPLLGLTWVFGVLTINANSTVFAWLFTIFNSLQGVFIFFFHVVRNDKVWSRISSAVGKMKALICKCCSAEYHHKKNKSKSAKTNFEMKKSPYQDHGSTLTDKGSTEVS